MFGVPSLKVEAFEPAISWLVISFCFAFTFNIGHLIYMFPISLLTVGIGFLAHELSHRFVATRFGCRAFYRMWGWGLLLALILSLASGGRIVFAAPGAVYISYPIYWYGVERDVRRLNGLISLAGPLANIVVAILFYLLSAAEAIPLVVGRLGFRVNIWLAIFNLLPIAPLDGWKVFSYSVPLWLLIISSALALWILV
jgi:Zn-dependent protease